MMRDRMKLYIINALVERVLNETNRMQERSFAIEIRNWG